jgi:hypothetical protein
VRTELGWAARGLHDGADQTDLNDRAVCHLPGAVYIRGSELPTVVEVGEPSVLQPAGPYQIGGVVQQVSNLIKFSQPRTRLVAKPEPTLLLAPCPPAWTRLMVLGARNWRGRDRRNSHWLIPPDPLFNDISSTTA